MNIINKLFDYLGKSVLKVLEIIGVYTVGLFLLSVIYICQWVMGSDAKSGKLFKYKIKNGKLFTKQKGLINIFTKWVEQ